MPEAIVAWIHRLADRAARHRSQASTASRNARPSACSRSATASAAGDDRRGGVHRRAFVDVVELENVRRDAVRQRRAGGRRSTCAKYHRLVRRPKRRHDLLRHARRRFESARHRGSEPVENSALRIGDSRARQGGERR